MKEMPAEVESWIGQRLYETEGEFDVERGYIFTTCAAVENGNPLFWDEKAANDITNGFIAPPSMISVWFRPHHWAPNRTERALPLQVHFDLKEALDLPGGTVGGDVASQVVVHHQHEGKRQAGRRQLLHHRRQGRARDTMAAQRRRWQQARQPRLRRRAEGFQGHPPLPFPPGGMGSHLLPREVPGRLHQGLLGRGQLGGITQGGAGARAGRGWMEDSCTMGPVKMHRDEVD